MGGMSNQNDFNRVPSGGQSSGMGIGGSASAMSKPGGLGGINARQGPPGGLAGFNQMGGSSSSE